MRKSVLMLIAAVVIDLTANQSARAADLVPREEVIHLQLRLFQFMYNRFNIFGPAVTSAETSVGRGQASTFPA